MKYDINRKKLLSSLAVAFVFFAAGTEAFAQSVSIDSISSPTMPSISSPTMGTGFYLPGNSSNPIYTGPSNPYGFSSNSSASTSGDSSKTSATEEKTSASSILSSTITAQDLSTMESLGLFNTVNSLFGSDSTGLGNINLSNLTTSATSSTTNLMLQQILVELEAIKEENKNLTQQLSSMQSAGTGTSAAGNSSNSITLIQTTEDSAGTKDAGSSGGQTGNSSSTAIDAAASPSQAKKSNPHFLRFNVNGYNVLSTIRSIYISQIQGDGSFLVTADRRYMSDGKTRTETFHILFKPNEASNGISSYSTATAVTQDYLNQYSFLYQLSQKGELNATRTGNLVSLRTDDPAWKLELLIDIGEQE